MKKITKCLAGTAVGAVALLPIFAIGKTAQKADFADKKAEITVGARKEARAADPQRANGIPAKKVYAWKMRNNNVPNGIVSFNLDQPANVTSEHALSNLAYAGCYANGKYYFDRYRNTSDSWEHIAFSNVDLATGQVTDIKNWSDEYFVVNDMTYDYSSNTIYAMVSNIYIDDFLPNFYFQYSGIWTINPNTGVITEVKQFIDWANGTLGNVTYYTIACDMNGTLYAVDGSGYLVKFDKENDYEEIEIGYTGVSDINHTTQTMEFDHTTGSLYWCVDHSKTVSELVMIDPVTAHSTVVGPTGSDNHLVGLYIPFDVPSQAAPAAVADFTATPDAGGANRITLSWTNPTKSFGGYNLAALSSVKVLRDGTEVASLSSPAIGGEMSWEDTDVPSAGSYTYTIVATNSAGNGMPSGLTRWVGYDVPAAVTNLGIGKTDEGHAYLEWEAPTEGQHGGVIDASTLGYKIIRFPDGTIIANDYKGTTYTDETVPGIGRYYYTIEPHTAAGAGQAKNSVEIAIGSGIESYPWSTLFADVSEFDLWTVVNNNGGSTWQWKSRTAGGYNSFAMYGYDNNVPGDDYLISPDLYMKKGGRYKVRFLYSGSNTTYTEKMDLTFGQGKTAEAQSQVLASYTMKDGDQRFAEVDLPEITETGNYNFAFHALSDKGQYNIYITDVTVSMTVAPPDDEPGGEDPDDRYDLKAPYNLNASVEDNTVTLTWNDASTNPGGGNTDVPVSGNIEEDFESMPKWAINPAGNYGWSYIDGDKGYTYVDDYEANAYPNDGAQMAAMVMAPYDTHQYIYDPNPPHSGNQYLLFKSNFYDENRNRPAPDPDDWFISPMLNFDQDFLFRFYCKADPDAEGWEPLWNTEEFRVGYSTTGKNPDDFQWMTDENERITTNFNEWKKKEYSIPADAKYVCIRYCTRNNGYWFMVDDVFIGIEGQGRNVEGRRNADAIFYYYEVLIDDVVVGTTQECTFTAKKIEKGTHVAKVRAVYKQGNSTNATTSFNVTSTLGIEDVVVDSDSNTVFDLAGRCLFRNATKEQLYQLAPGLYIINGQKVMVTK